MRLVYTETNKRVQLGDVLDKGEGEVLEIIHFDPPHKPSSSGKVTVQGIDTGNTYTWYVGVIGAEWIEREDRL